MSRKARLAVAATCAALAACETTGDPTRGGLFGWSESKARERQAERQEHVDAEQQKLSDEQARQHALETRETSAGRQLTTAERQNARAEERLRAQQAALLAKVGKLETESPTPASASRARSYRVKINTIVAQTALPTAERSRRLRTLEIEIDGALARAGR
jgi:uncharacterized membrane protein YqiK